MKRIIGILIILVLTVVGTGLALRLREQAGAGVPPAAPQVTEATVRRLQFEAELLDLPVAPDAQRTVADFNFSNPSDQPITIVRVDKTCTCLSVQISGGKLRYEAGEQGVIRATFELDNLVGEVEKSLGLFLVGDPDDKPSHTLTARLRIPVLVKLSAKTLRWDLGSKPEPQKIGIDMVHTKPIRITSTRCYAEGFQLDVKTLEDGQRYELWVTPKQTTEPGLALIRVETDCEIPRHRVLQVFAVIRKPLPGEEAPVAP